MKQISQRLRDTLIKEKYLKKVYGKDKDLTISSINKNGKGKTYWICEDILFNYFYNNEIQSDDKYYQIYYARRKEIESRKNNK